MFSKTQNSRKLRLRLRQRLDLRPLVKLGPESNKIAAHDLQVQKMIRQSVITLPILSVL